MASLEARVAILEAQVRGLRELSGRLEAGPTVVNRADPSKPWILLLLKVDGEKWCKVGDLDAEEIFRRALHGEALLQGECEESEIDFQFTTSRFATEADRDEADTLVRDAVDHLDWNERYGCTCYTMRLTESEARLWAQNGKHFQ